MRPGHEEAPSDGLRKRLPTLARSTALDTPCEAGNNEAPLRTSASPDRMGSFVARARLDEDSRLLNERRRYALQGRRHGDSKVYDRKSHYGPAQRQRLVRPQDAPKP